MAEIVIRPSAKLVQIAYTFIFVVIFVCILLYVNTPSLREISPWVLVIPALLLLWPLRYDVLRRFTRMTLAGDTLRYETGVLSRS
jgi:membrane protein YdbS with pleckstrin-like domain